MRIRRYFLPQQSLIRQQVNIRDAYVIGYQ
jgi:hypothetical protein